MQVEAIFFNNKNKNNQINGTNFNNLSEPSSSYSVTDRVIIGNDSATSLELYDKINTAGDENLKSGDTVTGTDPLGVSKESLNQFINSVTVDDYDKYAELGIIPDKEDPGNILTVSERIKIELMTYCDDYKPTGSDINFQDIKEYSSNEQAAYAIESKLKESNLPVTDENIEEVQSALTMAKDIITPITDSAKGYLLKNNMEPSISNVYISTYSGSSKMNTNSLTSAEWSELKPQIEEKMNEVGIRPDQGNMDNAKWIIEQKMPMTVDNLSLLENVNKINTDLTDDEMITKIVNTMSLGKQANDTLLTSDTDFVTRTQDAIDVLNNAGDAQLVSILQSGGQVTIENLKRDYSSQEADSKTKYDIVTAKKQLEEIRLAMTLEAGVKMLSKGIKIEVQPLKDLINELESQQMEYADSIFSAVDYEPSKEDAQQLQNTNDAVERLKSTPGYVAGLVVKKEIPFTLQDTIEAGEGLKSKLDAAGTAYDTFETTIRPDLGDNINKAFRSIPELLENLGLENSEVNNRAVRILSYNQMEVTKENVANVKQVYQEYQRLADNLKPRTTAYLIANKINPLNTDINELNDYVDEINEAIGEEKEEKYSEFLWKLEKQTDLSSQERDSYIGVYRLLNMVQKDGYSAIGSLINQGAQVTLKNLATAVKSKKSEELDVTVDDNFGEKLDNTDMKTVNVISQLSGFEERYYKQVTKTILENVTPSKLKNLFKKDDLEQTNIEVVQEELLKQGQENEAIINKQYAEEKIKSLNQMTSMSDDAFQLLLDNAQKVTPANLMAASNLLKIKKDLFSMADSSEIIDDLEDAQTAEDTYAEYEDKVNTVIDEKLESDDLQTLDLPKLKLTRDSLSLLTNFSKRNFYNIPVEINGEFCNVKLKIISDSEESGRISVEMENESLGKTNGEFTVDKDSLKGMIICESQEAADYINENVSILTKNLESIGIQTATVDCFTNQNMKTVMLLKKEAAEKQPTKNLYQTAKKYIKTLIEWSDNINL